MYDSPIKVFEQIPNIISEINNQKENLVYEAVAKVEVDVDKYELVKALQYDREQYSKGYSDGKIDGAREFAEWLPQIYRVLKNNTHCYIMINARNLKELWDECEKVGFVFQNIIVWDKGNVTPNKYYLNSYELILMLRKGKAKNINNMGTKNILRVSNIIGSKQHPTEKPVELMKILIENSSNVGDIVLEPFMGAGATGVASRSLNRNFIGIEIDEKYFKIAEQRISAEQNKIRNISARC